TSARERAQARAAADSIRRPEAAAFRSPRRLYPRYHRRTMSIARPSRPPPSQRPVTAEQRRLDDARGNTKWRRWGSYLSERQWGTVREDYSANGDAWNHFPHDHARLRAYRWGEDGLLGYCDNRGIFNFAVALWNGADPYLKER